MNENATLPPDEKLRAWAEQHGLWDNLEKGSDPTAASLMHSKIKEKRKSNSDASRVAQWISLLGWLSLLIGSLCFLVGVVNSGQSLDLMTVTLPMTISGILMLGFGSLVENVARIERHLRPPQ